MNEQSQAIMYKRYELISFHLERENFRGQMKGRIKPLTKFIPCAKALCFTAAMGNMASENSVSTVVLDNANRTICHCHPNLSEKDLWDLYYLAVEETRSES